MICEMLQNILVNKNQMGVNSLLLSFCAYLQLKLHTCKEATYEAATVHNFPNDPLHHRFLRLVLANEKPPKISTEPTAHHKNSSALCVGRLFRGGMLNTKRQSTLERGQIWSWSVAAVDRRAAKSVLFLVVARCMR